MTIAHPVNVIEGQLCLSVRYIEGHEPNPHCFVAIRSITTGEELSTTVDNVSMCIQLEPQVHYNVLATDADAVDEMDTIAAVTILGVVLPEDTRMPSIPTSILSSTGYALPTPTGI